MHIKSNADAKNNAEKLTRIGHGLGCTKWNKCLLYINPIHLAKK